MTTIILLHLKWGVKVEHLIKGIVFTVLGVGCISLTALFTNADSDDILAIVFIVIVGLCMIGYGIKQFFDYIQELSKAKTFREVAEKNNCQFNTAYNMNFEIINNINFNRDCSENGYIFLDSTNRKIGFMCNDSFYIYNIADLKDAYISNENSVEYDAEHGRAMSDAVKDYFMGVRRIFVGDGGYGRKYVVATVYLTLKFVNCNYQYTLCNKKIFDQADLNEFIENMNNRCKNCARFLQEITGKVWEVNTDYIDLSI